MSKATATVALLAVAAACAAGAAEAQVQNLTFTQQIDHLHGRNGTWQQRYTEQDTYHSGDGPVFVFMSGEAPMEFFAFQTVQIREAWAQQYQAMYINLEHRFYSPHPENNPYPGWADRSLDQLLTSEQALEDTAAFIRWHQQQHPSSKYVIFGCSYSGALSSFFRSRYPDLVVGGLAPSGPVLAQYNYTGFINKFPSSAGERCTDAVRESTAAIVALTQSAAGLVQLSRAFETCEPVTRDNLFYFLWSVVSSVASADQMNNPSDGPDNFILNQTCAILESSQGTPVTRFAAATAFNDGQEAAASAAATARGAAAAMRRRRVPHAQRRHASGCTSFSEKEFLDSLRDTSNANRAWWFQKCNEFGFFKPSYAGTSVFVPGLPVEHIAGYCAAIFGSGAVDMSLAAIQQRIDATNAHYGGKKVPGTNILFTNGDSDPWHLLSVTEDNAAGTVKAVTYAAGHCAPLTKATSHDPPSLVNARAVVAAAIGEWLA